jgi:hypothetical protein
MSSSIHAPQKNWYWLASHKGYDHVPDVLWCALGLQAAKCLRSVLDARYVCRR